MSGIRIDEATLRRMGAKVSPSAKERIDALLQEQRAVKAPPSNCRKMRSKTERMFADYLDDLKAAGTITRWRYEAMRFQLLDVGAPRKTYECDFVAWLPDKTQWVIEVKPRRFILSEQKARTTYLWAKQQYETPYVRFFAYRRTDSGWREIWQSESEV